MQTIERPSQAETPRPRPPWGPAALAAIGIASLPVLIFAIFNKWGVLILVLLAMTAGLAMWVWRRGFVLIEVVAFLIHFDGVGAGPIRIGRIIAGIGACILVYKFVVEKWRPPAVPLRNWLPIAFLTVWSVASGIWSKSIGGWIQTMLMFGLAVVYFCMTSMLVDSHKSIQKFLRAYWVGGLIGSAAGILALVLGTRSVGFGSDPNFFGLLEASMIPLTVYYRRHTADARMRWLYTFALIFVLAGAAGAGSRSGLIGGSLAIVLTMVTRPGLSHGKRAKVAGYAMLLAPLAFIVGFIANPNNLARGLTSDRGAGRLDLWTVSADLISERPIVGYGLGQIQWMIPERLLVTPGSQRFNESREAVSTHNTWMDSWGDLGLIGLTSFVAVFVVAVYSLLRPRWLYMKELSTTLFVMMVPVFSSSMFLPLFNNKLAWGILGLAAATQVPSEASRWSGLAGTRSSDQELKELSRSRGGRPGGTDLVHVPAVAGSNGVAIRTSSEPVADPYHVEQMPDIEFARWDYRVPGSVLKGAAISAVLAGVLMFVVATKLPDTYVATGQVLAPKLDTSVSQERLRIEKVHMQGVLTLPVSEAYADELKRLSGVQLSVPEIQSRMEVSRPKMSALIRFTFSDTTLSNTEAVQPYMLTALNNVYENAREESSPRLANEARPTRPGEQQYYTGPAFLPMDEAVPISVEGPMKFWMALMSMGAVGLGVISVSLIGSRRPRIAPRDDYLKNTGLRVATRVGGGRNDRSRTSKGQLQQLVVAATTGADVWKGERIVLAPTDRSGPSRRMALGVATALIDQGRRVVLVDAQVDRPLLSLRLGGWNGAGIAEEARPDVWTANDADGSTLELREVSPRRLPAEARELLGGRSSEFRFVSGGRFRFRRNSSIDVAALDQLDETVTVVVLAPPAGSGVAVAPLYKWADTVLVAMNSGRTTTVDAENSAATARAFARRSAIVLSNT